MDAHYIEVHAEVRYWEDADVNGVEDTDGSLIPCKNGGLWMPVIRMEDGQIMGWPEGTTADIHYKVCDQGEYWLLDAERERIAKWRGDYVPNSILCIDDNGYGDYIIMRVDERGAIINWRKPAIGDNDWEGNGYNPGISPADYQRLVAWMSDPQRKPSGTAFTAGAVRDAARAFEDYLRKTKEEV